MAAPAGRRRLRWRAAPWPELVLVLLMLGCCVTPGLSAAPQPPPDGAALGSVTSVTGLAAEMYRQMKGRGGAYKLLSAAGPAGSQGSPDFDQPIDAPLVDLDSLGTDTRDAVVVLVPVRRSVAFMQQLLADPALQRRVRGVLVDDTEPPESFSSLGRFPGAEYAPYADRDWPWNAAAAAAGDFAPAFAWLPAPFFLLSRELAADARARAAYNARQDARGEQYHARMQLTMSAAASNSSLDCIPAGTCKPLGGYSVWCSLPPLPPDDEAVAAQGGAGAELQLEQGQGQGQGQGPSMPIVLVVAQMDGIDMFHDAIQGADAPLSGLVAMMVALHALRAARAAAGRAAAAAAPPRYTRRLAFLALAGEPWGYMGSRRLLWEAEGGGGGGGGNSTRGLRMDLVEHVVEVGQVGRLAPGAPAAAAQGGGAAAPGATLYVHSQRGGGFGDAAPILEALQAAAAGEASSAGLGVAAASERNPGIPPSSLMAFLRVKPSIRGAVLAEFDASFSNPFYGSRFDNGSAAASAAGVAAAAAVLAGGLHRLAGGAPEDLWINSTELLEAAASYLSCVASPSPGFACPLAAALMAPDYEYDQATGSRSYAPRHYVGVLQHMPPVQSPLGKGNLARLLWNAMALDTAEGPRGAACDPFKQKCGEGQVCAGWRGSGDAKLLGRCVNATVRYVPSYSTRLNCSACGDPWTATWQLTDAADGWAAARGWPADPVWAESDWPLGVPELQLYLREAPAVEAAVLAAGIAVTAAALAASLTAKAAFHRHHKSS